MGFFDYVSDMYSSLSIQTVEAEASEDQKYASGDFNSSKDQTGGTGTAQQRGGAATGGGASTSTPASGTDEESSDEAEVNKADAKTSGGSGEKGHTPGDGGEGSGQDEEEEEEEEEEDDEPVDLKPKFEEECIASAECAPAKHHYDHCVERVEKQQEENGKASEDCVEEFFHLMHCATNCAAPKLFKALR
ncbi:hypothetical protein AAFC00_004887 [Neodothiora populina]|uniref:Ubiquinol-cytochrome C reductase hinge domain-containing protein n=1 Tax=Neodothiora populina TaxID=2781224 RepID=A0ABR3P3T8_9PEZI